MASENAGTGKSAVDINTIPLDQLDPSEHHRFGSGESYPLFARLRKEDPVHYCKDSPFGPYWSVTRFEDIKHVDTHPAIYSSSYLLGGASIDDQLAKSPIEGFVFKGFIMLDPPEHGKYRKVVQPIVSTRSLDNMRAEVTERTRKILDSLPLNEPFDWVKTVSVELTSAFMATLFDVPYEDRHKLREWSDATAAVEGSEGYITQEQRIATLMGCMQYFGKLFQERAAQPPKFDLVSMLAHDEMTRQQSPMDLLGTILLLIVGANDTTRNSMSASAFCADRFPEQFEMVKKDRSLIDPMVKEIVRWLSPICHQRRTATQDTELGGKKIRKGDKVVMWYFSGNRDESVFPNAEKIDISRENVNHHIAFGFGVHRCLGMRAAELQLRILWQEMLDRFEKIELIGEPKRLSNNQVNAYTEMMVRLTPKQG